MRLCVAQSRPTPGDFERNIESHVRLLETAVGDRADIVIFPELSLSGYEPALAKKLATTVDDCRFRVFQRISDTSATTIGVGAPIRLEAGIAIGMLIFQPGHAIQQYSKHFLHADEEPYFIPGERSPGLIGKKRNVALAICYELSVPEHAESAFRRGANTYIASVVKLERQMDRALERMSYISRSYAMTALMSNCVGQSEGQACGGRSSIWNSNGELIAQLNATDEGILVFDTDTQAVA